MNRKKIGRRAGGVVFLFLLFLLPTSVWGVDKEDCLACHGDPSLVRSESTGMKDSLYVDERKFRYAVHNVYGITCVDCHADITELNWENEVPHSTNLAPVSCEMCHYEEGEAYQESVHHAARNKGITIPCYACHAYHYTTPLATASVLERQNSFCLKCHDPGKYHDWLPQKEAHFTFVECSVCHAPETPRHVNLRFYDLVESKFLESEVLFRTLNTDMDGFMALVDQNGNGVIDVEELEDLMLMLRQRNVRGIFHGEMVADIAPSVHQVQAGGAVRDCEQCHSASSPFFDNLTLSLDLSDGTLFRPEVDRRVLETYYMSFYALGATRVRLLDRIGIALIIGGVAVVVLHLTVRILTIPLRRKDRS